MSELVSLITVVPKKGRNSAQHILENGPWGRELRSVSQKGPCQE